MSSSQRVVAWRCRAAALNSVRLGYFTPDSTAYEDVLTTFDQLDPAWIELPAEEGFRIDPDVLGECLRRDQLDTLLDLAASAIQELMEIQRASLR